MLTCVSVGRVELHPIAKGFVRRYLAIPCSPAQMASYLSFLFSTFRAQRRDDVSVAAKLPLSRSPSLTGTRTTTQHGRLRWTQRRPALVCLEYARADDSFSSDEHKFV